MITNEQLDKIYPFRELTTLEVEVYCFFRRTYFKGYYLISKEKDSCTKDEYKQLLAVNLEAVYNQLEEVYPNARKIVSNVINKNFTNRTAKLSYHDKLKCHLKSIEKIKKYMKKRNESPEGKTHAKKIQKAWREKQDPVKLKRSRDESNARLSDDQREVRRETKNQARRKKLANFTVEEKAEHNKKKRESYARNRKK